jgi:hypothetical protein
MQVRCIKEFGNAKPGEIVSGLMFTAQIDPEHWEVVADEPPAPPTSSPAPSLLSAVTVTPKEGVSP